MPKLKIDGNTTVGQYMDAIVKDNQRERKRRIAEEKYRLEARERAYQWGQELERRAKSKKIC